jgi:hypothetical protein
LGAIGEGARVVDALITLRPERETA